MSSGRRAIAFLPFLVLAVLGTAPSTEAQTTPTTRLRLASQTPWVGPGGELVLRVAVETSAAPDEAELAVSVFRRVSSRSEFALTLEDRVRGSALAVTATALADLTPDSGGALVVRLPVQDPLQPLDVTRLRLRDEGVYPVRVEVRRTGGGAALARLTTHLVYATPPTDGAPKLLAALVLPVHAAPALQPDGTRDMTGDGRARLAGLAAALDADTAVPFTLAPTPETLQALAASEQASDRETLAALRRAVAGRQVLGRTYVPISTQAFAATGLETEANAQDTRGRRVIEETLDVSPDRAVALVDEALGVAALRNLRARQVDRLVVPERLLSVVDLPITLAQPFQLETREVRRPAALVADAALAAHFDAGADPVLAAHHLLGDLAVIASDRPGRPRGVVAMPPRSWKPNRAFLAVVLDGLADGPIVSGATVEGVFTQVPPAATGRGTTLLRTIARDDGEGPAPLPVERVRAVRRHLQSFSGMLDPANPLDDALEEQLLVAESVDVRGQRRTSYLDGLDRLVDAQLALVRVPESRTITLTARRGEIPVTVLNETGYPVRVEVRVASDKLGFPDSATRDLELTRRNTTERFSVEARASGAFPLRVRLFTPDGSLLVAESRFTVRSTTFSGVGLLLSAGALGVLLTWWARHVARGRRNRRLIG